MSRIEENKELLETSRKTFTGNIDECAVKVQMCMYSMLADISKSLAVIADKLGDEPESDAYVRDHQLIQWAYDHKYWLDGGSTIEDIYKHWIEDVGGKL